MAAAFGLTIQQPIALTLLPLGSTWATVVVVTHIATLIATLTETLIVTHTVILIAIRTEILTGTVTTPVVTATVILMDGTAGTGASAEALRRPEAEVEGTLPNIDGAEATLEAPHAALAPGESMTSPLLRLPSTAMADGEMDTSNWAFEEHGRPRTACWSSAKYKSSFLNSSPFKTRAAIFHSYSQTSYQVQCLVFASCNLLALLRYFSCNIQAFEYQVLQPFSRRPHMQPTANKK